MSELSALRLYFPHTARAKSTRFWHRLTASALGHRLLAVARRSGIRQALMHSVHAGYLQGNKVTYLHIESLPAQHPLCLELIDAEERLRAFVREHADELQHGQ